MLHVESVHALLHVAHDPPHAGQQIVVEEFLDGEEASYFALVVGNVCIPLGSAQACLYSA